MAKPVTVSAARIPASASFTPELLAHAVVEMRQTNRAGHYGFRVRCIADKHGDERLILAATQWRDDYDMGVEGLREAVETGGRVDEGVSTTGYSDALLDAGKRHRECTQFVGQWASSVLHLILVGDPQGKNAYQPLSSLQLGKRLGFNDSTALGIAIAALERLAEWYERPRR